MSGITYKGKLNIMPSYTITFHKDGVGQIGVLDFNGPAMKFEGDAEESAKVFFNWIADSFKGRFEELEREKYEAVALAEVMRDALGDVLNTCEASADDGRIAFTAGLEALSITPSDALLEIEARAQIATLEDVKKLCDNANTAGYVWVAVSEMIASKRKGE